MKWKTRRKLSGTIVDGKALLRFSIPFLVMILTSVALILAMHWQLMTSLNRVQTNDRLDPVVLASITDTVAQMTLTGTIGILILGLVCLGFWIIFSHRIFGPMIPFRRHIVNLIEKKYDSRVRLRKTDEFKELAQDLNRLAESLGVKSE